MAGVRVGWIFAIVLALAGCASPVPVAAPTSPPAAASTAGPGTSAAAAAPAASSISGEITYAWWGTSAFRNEVSQQVISLFQQKYPNVKVDPSIADFNTHFQKLTVSAAAGDLPCVPQMQSTGSIMTAPHFVGLANFVSMFTAD